MNTNEYAEEKKQNFFFRIFNFVKNLFKTTNALPAPEILDDDVSNENVITNDIELNSINELNVEHKVENPELLDLQKRFESNQISLADLSDEDLNNLNELYLKQIDELNSQLMKVTF